MLDHRGILANETFHRVNTASDHTEIQLLEWMVSALGWDLPRP